MPTNCKCETPPFHFLDFDQEVVGEERYGAEVFLEKCAVCGRTWLKYLVEEPHYSRSGRWWRVPVQSDQIAIISAETARAFIERQPWCFVGGSYFDSTGHLVRAPIKIV
ncbi:MAG: hypothetical protein PHD54_08930 [Desulfuromonadaceae bacterium]|nr:hypothetical protein [Desulfuromonadaceae bacterium]